MTRATRRNRFLPVLDTMESRDCPTVTCVNTAGVLQITGDQADNTVVITTSSAGAVSVVGDGQTFSFQGVQSIKVGTGDGNDTVRLCVNEGATAFGVTASVDLGGGNDTFKLGVKSSAPVNYAQVVSSAVIDVKATGSIGNDTLSATIGSATAGTPAMLVPAVRLCLDGAADNDAVSLGMTGTVVRKQIDATLKGGDGADAITQDFSANNFMAPLNLTIAGGAGDDRISSKFDNTGARSVYNAPIAVNVTGDAGNDTISFALGGWQGTGSTAGEGANKTDPVVNVKFNFTLDGGDGSDTVAASAVVAPQGVGSLNGQVLGGNGDDDLTLDLSGVPATFSAIGLIDGGAGFDTHHSSPTVSVVNCEA